MVLEVVWVEEPDAWLQPLVNALDEAVHLCQSPSSQNGLERTIISVSIQPRCSVDRCEGQHHDNPGVHGFCNQTSSIVPCDSDRFQSSDTITLKAHPAVQNINSQSLLRIPQLRHLQRQGKLVWAVVALVLLMVSLWLLFNRTSLNMSTADPFAKPKCAGDKPPVVEIFYLHSWQLAILVCNCLLLAFIIAHLVNKRLFFMVLFSFDALVLNSHALFLHILVGFSEQSVIIAAGNFSVLHLSLSCVYRATLVLAVTIVSVVDAVLAKRCLKVALISMSMVAITISHFYARFRLRDSYISLEICHWSLCQRLDQAVLQTEFTLIVFHAKLLFRYALGRHIVLLNPTWRMYSGADAPLLGSEVRPEAVGAKAQEEQKEELGVHMPEEFIRAGPFDGEIPNENGVLEFNQPQNPTFGNQVADYIWAGRGIVVTQTRPQTDLFVPRQHNAGEQVSQSAMDALAAGGIWTKAIQDQLVIPKGRPQSKHCDSAVAGDATHNDKASKFLSDESNAEMDGVVAREREEMDEVPVNSSSSGQVDAATEVKDAFCLGRMVPGGCM